MNESPLLSMRGVHYHLGETPVLLGVDAAVHPGELVGLIGPNGAGKSTLLKVAGGLWPGFEGQIDLLGQPLQSYKPRALAQLVAHVPQHTYVDFPFTAREIVLMGRSPYLSRFQMEGPADRAVAERALTATDTSHLADRMVNTLSGGERQRVLLARALAQEPRLLLLDEPTSNLDLKHQHRALTLARQLAREHRLGIMVAVHDLTLAARYCDRLILLLCGRVLAEGTPEQVLTPEHLRHAFDIDAQIYRDPVYNTLALAIRDI